MSVVISVRFRNGNKNYDFDPQGLRVRTGDDVIVETAQGIEFASCTRGNHELPESAVVRPLCRVLRLATDADRRTMEYHRRREKDAFAIAEQKIADHGLEMKLVNVSSGFEGNKIIFFFTADGRVDFRALVRDLAGVFRSRIELRQIGVRDEARMVGGLGICGRPFCCAQFLDTFLPVSIKMAKTQNLSLNPAKISGACGRLMCCLKYEQYAYEDAARRLPKADSFVQTPDGPGDVKAVDLLRETVKVSLDSEPEPYRTYHADEVILLRGGKGGREGITLPPRPARHADDRREEAAFEPVFLESYEWDGTEETGGRDERTGAAPVQTGAAPVQTGAAAPVRNSVPERRQSAGRSGPASGRNAHFQSAGRNAPFQGPIPGMSAPVQGPVPGRTMPVQGAGRNAPIQGLGKNAPFQGPVPGKGGGQPSGRAVPDGQTPAPLRGGRSPYQERGQYPDGTPGPAVQPSRNGQAVPGGGRQSGTYGRNPPPTAEDWADFENMAALYAPDEFEERHRNRNQNNRRGRMEQRGNGKFQKQGQKRDFPKKDAGYEGGEQKRRGNRNYYRGNRRDRGGNRPAE